MTLPPFEEIARGYGPTVLRVCRALLDPAAAQDAWSETFLSALRAYPDLRPGSNIEAWLVTIAHRKAIDQHRAVGRAPLPVPELPEGSEPSAEDVACTGDSTVWTALRALPFKQRAAVAYHHVAGLPYAEIAGILGQTEAAARRAAADGIKALRAGYRRPGEQGADR